MCHTMEWTGAAVECQTLVPEVPGSILCLAPFVVALRASHNSTAPESEWFTGDTTNDISPGAGGGV